MLWPFRFWPFDVVFPLVTRLRNCPVISIALNVVSRREIFAIFLRGCEQVLNYSGGAPPEGV
jgi:hypothetical protein